MSHPTAPTTSATPGSTLPARIAMQIRDGALNELHAFDIATYGTRGSSVPGAKLDHRIDTRDIITALAIAQQKLIEELRADNTGKHPAFWTANEQWFMDLAAWTVAG